MYGDKFEKGMFLTKSYNKGNFIIFEGLDISTSYSKKYSILAMYDPHKYCRKDETSYDYEYKEYIETATSEKRCSETLSDDKETSWIRKCTDEEKNEAINKLHEFGYDWSDELMSLIDMETGEIIRKIPIVLNEYNGEIIHPLTRNKKNLLYDYVEATNNPQSKYPHSPYYSKRYNNYYNDYGYDYDDYYCD